MDHALTTVLLPAARRIDAASAAIGRLAAWLVLVACLLSVCNALMRYGAHFAQPMLLDLPMLLFAGIVLGGAPRTLAENSHIRVDILYRSLAPRRRAAPRRPRQRHLPRAALPRHDRRRHCPSSRAHGASGKVRSRRAACRNGRRKR